MRFLLVLAFSAVAIGFAPAQKKTYVCLPCGSSCDKTLLDKPGTCRSCGMKLVEQSSISFTNITLEEMCKRVAANPNAVLLDVRSPEEFKGTSMMTRSFGHFKNAININVEELESRVNELTKYKGQEVLVYCSHSHRSPRASYFLSTHGFENVKNMEGGVSTLKGLQNDCLKKIYVPHAR